MAVTPRARGRAGVAAFKNGVLHVRVAAPPAEGRANDELIKTVAAFLGVPKSRVTVVRGAAARRKLLSVEGITPEALTAALACAPKPVA